MSCFFNALQPGLLPYQGCQICKYTHAAPRRKESSQNCIHALLEYYVPRLYTMQRWRLRLTARASLHVQQVGVSCIPQGAPGRTPEAHMAFQSMSGKQASYKPFDRY